MMVVSRKFGIVETTSSFPRSSYAIKWRFFFPLDRPPIRLLLSGSNPKKRALPTNRNQAIPISPGLIYLRDAKAYGHWAREEWLLLLVPLRLTNPSLRYLLQLHS